LAKYTNKKTISMKIAYTVCTINHLWQARGVAESFLKHNPDYKFLVCIADQPPPHIDFATYDFPFEICWIDELEIPELPQLIAYYNAFCLLMALKGMAADVLMNKYNPSHIVYLDTDILVFDNFAWAEQQLTTYDILITPHCHLPPPYQTPLAEVKPHLLPKNPYEDRIFLLTGLFNAGFVVFKNSPQGRGFAAWWSKNLKNQCLPSNYLGLFYDQVWLSLVPVYFDKACIVRNLGYNVGCWSFHERKISQKDGRFYVNEHIPLIFFHYTGYRHNNPNKIAEWIDLTLDDMPELKPIFEAFTKLTAHKSYQDLHQIPCAFAAQHQVLAESRKVKVPESFALRVLRKVCSFLPSSFRNDLKRVL
jgi:hypothetical protein